MNKIRNHSLIGLMGMIASLALFSGGCGDDDGGGEPDAMLSAACAEADSQSDLQWIQDNIFTTSCAVASSCHGTPGAQGLDLTAGVAEAELVGQMSGRFTDKTLVVPGDPANSYLMVVLGSYEGELSASGTMPPGVDVLCEQKREAVERWIMSLPTM